MKLNKVNEALNHKIVGSSEHQWNCWDYARFLDYETEYAYASVVFNSRTQEVYEAEVNDKENQHKPYRWLNPKYKQSYIDEGKNRNVDVTQAWDNVQWVDLETEEDWLDKAKSIMEGNTFDTRISMPIDLDKEELFQLMSLAHEKDITLNQLVEQILEEVIRKHE